MIGVLLVTHGKIGDALLNALYQILGTLPAIEAVGVDPHDDMELCERRIEDALTQVDRGEGVIILTDLYGGTPSNLAERKLETGKVELISGVNLPMLVKLARIREKETLEKTAQLAHEAAIKYINIASLLAKTEPPIELQ